MASRKVKYDFNPFMGLRGEARKKAADELKEFVRNAMIDRMRSGSSPVSGQGGYRALTKDYAKAKKGGNRVANLRLDGDLYASVQVTDSPSGGLRATVSPDQQAKADGHNNFSGKSTLPRRAFIPDARSSEKFKADIERGMSEIVRKYKNGDQADSES